MENFKRFDKLDIEIKNNLTGDIADQFLILGDNGSGKTTILQAIALCLSMASRQIEKVEDFDWIGWLPGRYYNWGTPVIELEVHFTDEEIDATKKISKLWWDIKQPGGNYIEPGDSQTVTVSLNGGRVKRSEKKDEIFQFQGRQYAKSLLRLPGIREYFNYLPGIFWFDQFRNLASQPSINDNGENSKNLTFEIGVARLREFLNKWWMHKQLSGSKKGDYLFDLERIFQKIFPKHKFAPPEPIFSEGVPSPSDYYFMISDGSKTYDIEEMSAGEQSIFPMLYEFVRMQIKNSVVLIDEIDLNLHPPLAQALLSALPELGPGCQYIYTTHSEAISSVVSPEEIYRLEGGKLCL